MTRSESGGSYSEEQRAQGLEIVVEERAGSSFGWRRVWVGGELLRGLDTTFVLCWLSACLYFSPFIDEHYVS